MVATWESTMPATGIGTGIVMAQREVTSET
jgi:hypothetical protein